MEFIGFMIVALLIVGGLWVGTGKLYDREAMKVRRRIDRDT
jgi:hypothetical protein